MTMFVYKKILFLFLSVILTPGILNAQNWFTKPSGFTDYQTPEAAKPSMVISTEPAKKTYSNGFMRFWEDLTGDALEDLCKAAQLDLSEKVEFPNDVIVLKAGYKRSMKRFPNNQIALIDELTFKPGFAVDIPAPAPLLPADGSVMPVSLSLTMNASIEGKSQVVRPLKGEEYCTEIKTWAKLYNLKTAWPATTKRISKMKTGEIWKLPLTFHISAGIEGSVSPYKMVTFSLSAGTGMETTPSVTLFRMSEDKMRLRVRLGKAKMTTAGVKITSTDIPFENFALWQTDKDLLKLGFKELSKQINDSLATKFSYTKTHFKGKKLVLEFICNPQDPEQLKAIASFLRGDFSVLRRFIELNLDFTNYEEGETVQQTAVELQEMANTVNSGLHGSQTYAGASHYDGRKTDMNFQLPLIYKRESEKERTTTSYQAVDSDERMNVYKYRKKIKSGHMNIPFAGSMHKKSRETTSYVVQKEYRDGSMSTPSFMYQEYSGSALVSAKNARESIERANDILQYVGTQGNGTNTEYTIKEDQAIPAAVIKDGKTVKPSNAYKSVASEFKLMINEKGIQEIIFAPAAAIMKAVFNIFHEKFGNVIDKAADMFRISESGEVYFDKKEARMRFGQPSPGDINPIHVMKKLAAKATNVIADIFHVKKASDNKQQADRFASLAQGGGSLGATDFLKVVVQLLDPADVSATFTMDSKNKKTGKHHYEASLNASEKEIDANLKEVQDAEGRFNEPTALTD
jgi:hypothetical protein